MTRFAGKVALVTGASSGMGAATADLLAEGGARVFTAQRGATAHESIAADFSDRATPARVIDHVKQAAGGLDILINNAGMMLEGTVEETSEEDWDAQLHLNLTIPFLMIRAAMPLLKAAQGAIVNTGSIEGIASNPRHPAYCASKAGLHGLTRAVAVDEGRYGVRCNAVAPGWIDTPLNEAFIESLGDPATFRQGVGRIHPLRRTGTPPEVARLICWLASDEAGFVTGQTYTIDGGRTAQLSLP